MRQDRPRRDTASFLMRIRMSRWRLWVLVEGDPDRAYAARMLRAAGAHDALFQVSCADEVKAAAGRGKHGLLTLLRDVQSAGGPEFFHEDGKRVLAFMVDRDGDDYVPSVQHPFLVRSIHFAVENDVVLAGDIASAAAAVIGVDAAHVAAALVPSRFREEAARAIREWVEFCFFVHVNQVDRVPHYGCETSRFHAEPWGPLDVSRRDSLYGLARSLSGLSDAQFDLAVQSSIDVVAALYDVSAWDRVFNGKWYISMAAARIRGMTGVPRLPRKFKRDLLRRLIDTVDCDSDWALPLRDQWRSIIAATTAPQV